MGGHNNNKKSFCQLRLTTPVSWVLLPSKDLRKTKRMTSLKLEVFEKERKRSGRRPKQRRRPKRRWRPKRRRHNENQHLLLTNWRSTWRLLALSAVSAPSEVRRRRNEATRQEEEEDKTRRRRRRRRRLKRRLLSRTNRTFRRRNCWRKNARERRCIQVWWAKTRHSMISSTRARHGTRNTMASHGMSYIVR